ncbi:T9SS type A sorting domain-containing protein [Brumimicrobium glaciale]|uniref:T9SS type A sorting domain-containing protein n=1 Tax=Brumimicrobium glaciale TaxID=200475 RepID=A0A4Q4KQ94_9FLAO|nr:fibronectin type III domain-containing protein [Brumimicrobium glaciale]RYM35646.1 T9SS type A sorting domain-containing protein [Brumimicrobium glaciale]
MKQFTFSLFVAMLLGTFSVQAQSYCTYGISPTSNPDHFISQFSTSGGTANINNSSVLSTGGYGDYSSMSVQSYIGGTFDYSMAFNISFYSYGYAIWIDWNNDGTFDLTERVADNGQYQVQGVQTGTITVPAGTIDGDYRMRVAMDNDIYSGASMLPCNTAGKGEAEDYTVGIYASNSTTCDPISNILVAGITTDAADISWTVGGTETEWDVIYGPTGFDPNLTGTTVNVTTLPQTTLTILASDTKYDVYVKAICGPGDESFNFGPKTFRTKCSSTTIPYSMNFENVTYPNIDHCTSQENAGTGNDWETAYHGSNGFTSKVLKYTSHPTNNANAWFYTQGIQLTAGTNYKISYKYGNNSSNYSEQLSVFYGTTPGFGDMTNFIAQHNGITGGQATTEIIDFTVTTTDIYYFGFKAGSVLNQLDLFLDDINIFLGPSCLPPSNLMVSNAGLTDADLSWTAGSSETEWNVLYGERGFNPATQGTTVNVTGTPATTITGLLESTEYEYYVTAVCGVNDMSARVGSFVFETTCTSTTVPYAIDFESAVLPKLSFCTSKENVGGGNEWKTQYYYNHGFTGNVLTVENYNTDNSANAWFYTQGLELTAGVEYEISYTYGNTPSYTESMEVAYGTSALAANMNTQLAFYDSINSGQATDTIHTFMVPADGVYYFGFNAISDSIQNQILLDNINIVKKEVCDKATGILVSDVQNLQATISWSASASATAGYEVEVFEAGEDPATATPVATEIVAAGITTVTITGLNAGTAYDAYVIADCDQLGTTMSDSVNFTTGTVGLASNELTQITYSPNPVNSVLNITAENTIESVIVYNLTGKAVLEVNTNNTSISIDMSSLSNGTYFVKAKVANAVSTFKVVKQ